MNEAHRAADTHNPWLAQPVTIHRVTAEISGVATYFLQFNDVEMNRQYDYRPGQFNMLYLPGVGEMPISLSDGSTKAGTWAHTVRVVGRVTAALARLRPGDGLGLRGPFGSCWPVEDAAGCDMVIAAGGIGLAPLRPVLRFLLSRRQDFGRLRLLYGARSPDLLLYQNEFSAWQAAGLELQTTVDRSASDWSGNVGVVPLLIDRLWPVDPAKTRLLICGPEVMMRYSVRSALQRGIGKHQIWVSLERNMQCAAGLCGHCQLGPAFVCKDGPIFRYDAAEWLMRVEQL